LVTFFSIVFIGLLVGVQAGIAVALAITAFRLGSTRANIHIIEQSGLSYISIQGSLTFMSAKTLETIRHRIAEGFSKHGFVVDLSQVRSMDASGAHQLIDLLEPLIIQKKIALTGLEPDFIRLLLDINLEFSISDIIATDTKEIFKILNITPGNSQMNKVRYGVVKFKQMMSPSHKTLFSKLASAQTPHTLFVSCSDSRIDPNLITSTGPGELFVLRNIGNIVPAAESDSLPAEGAAVEFALAALGIQEIIICGHSECGAISQMLSGTSLSSQLNYPVSHIDNWLKQLDPVKASLRPNSTLKDAVLANVLLQVENLKTYSIVKEKLIKGELRIFAWYYDIGHSELEEWDEVRNEFSPIGAGSHRKIV
jgi:carbonic anhydrase